MDFDASITDYLNGHLDAEARAAFETAMAKDPELAARVNTERLWQANMQAQRKTAPQDFTTFATHLQRPRLPRLAQSVFAGGALVALLITLTIYMPREDAQYRTLTEPPVSYSHVVVRVILGNTADMQTIASEFDITVLHSYPAAYTIDVDPNSMTAATRQKLEEDPRVRLLQVVTPP
ncbi:MAG: hypothetical protein AAF993_18805 [Pseudomonadota bacterium]